ncbi:MAG: hypothetical protein E7213_11630, partial [Clostridium sp.]|nr:hypothetical protein [Clostridium sp.]
MNLSVELKKIFRGGEVMECSCLGRKLVLNKYLTNKGITFVKKEKDKFISYSELYKSSLKILNAFNKKKLSKGQKAVIYIEDEEKYIYCLWACILGGITAVPLPVTYNEEGVDRVFKVWNKLDSPYMITSNNLLDDIEKISKEKDKKETFNQISKNFIDIDKCINEKSEAEALCDIDDSSTALIMFSSGSTGEPKGIVLSYKNVGDAVDAAKVHLEVKDDDIFLNWMPITHAIGLNFFHVLPLSAGVNQVLIDRKLFVQNPIIWMDKANEYRASILISPNIGFKQFMNSIEDNKKYNWELSCVRSFIGSAEPLSEDLLNKFLDGLEKYNLNKNSMKNLYGMTESVLGITLTPAHKSMDFVRLDRKYLNIGDKVQSDKAGEGVVFAVSGTPLSSLEVRICDDDDNVLEDGVIGNIQVKGSNMTSGYYKNDLENKNLYTEDLWMRTGDIGFISNNNTVITGRKKDIIILNGQNIYAVDIERIVRQAEVKGVKKVAVCGAFDTKFYGEKLEIFVEYEGTLEQFIEDKRKIKGFISKKISIEVDNIIPIDEMPETSSGKIQRNVLKKRYLNGNFKEIIKKIQEKDFKKVSNDGHAEKDEVNDLIKNICCDILQEKDIGVDQDLFELGLHSISIMKIQSKIKKELDVEIEISDFINNNTIALLAEKVKNSYAVESISYPSLDSNKQDLYKPFPLTQVQMAYLMGRNENIEGGGVCTHFYHEIKTKYDIKKLNKCLNKLIDYYPMLRAVFNENGSQKILEHVPEYTILNKDISTFSNEEKEKFILNERKIMSHQVFEIDKWPLFEFKSYKVSSEDSYLFVSFDLLIADAASIFDIGQMLVDMYNNEEYNLPKIDFTFRDYMMGYKELRKSKLYEEDKNYWMEKIDDFSSAPALPYKINSTELKKPRYKRVSQIVSEEVWIKLKALARKNRVTPSSVLCTAYAKVLGFWSNQESLALNLTAFNRYPFNKDVDNIFGDFTSVVPLDISIDKQTEFFDQARRVQSTLMNSLQHRHYDGVEFIRELSRNNKFEIGKAVMPIVFSSLLFDNGRYGWNELGTIEMAVSQTPQVFIDNQVMEYDGKLLTSWDYVDELFDEKVINRMFEQYIDILNNVAQGNIDYSLDVSEEDKKFINKFNDTDVEREAKTL